MKDKFGFGIPSAVVKELGHFPGQQYSVLGPRKVVPGLSTLNDFANHDFTFGEIVKINSYEEGAYIVRPIDDADTDVENIAVIMRDIVGGVAYNEAIVKGPKKNVPFSLFLLNDDQYADVVVPVAELVGHVGIVVGGEVFIGKGAGTVIGAVYGEEQGALGVDTLKLEGWEFKTLPFEPSSTDAKAVVIGRKV